MLRKRYLLTIPNSSSPISLIKPCPICPDHLGNKREFDTLDPDCFGKSLVAKSSEQIRWRAISDVSTVAKLPELNALYGGLIASPRVKECIERFQSFKLEFIPIDIYYSKTDSKIAEWWFINIYNWKNVFNYGDSKLEYAKSDFEKPLNCVTSVSARFGSRAILNWTSLSVNVDQTMDGIFLAESTTKRIWENIFISRHLVDSLVALTNNPKFAFFKYFWCDSPPGDQFSDEDYEYCGA